MAIRVDSIRLRLTLWYAAILAIALVAMAVATYTLLDRLATARATASLIETGGAVLATGGRGERGLENAVRRFRAPDRRVVLYAPDGRVLAASDPPPFGPPVAEEVFAAVPPLRDVPVSRRPSQPAGADARPRSPRPDSAEFTRMDTAIRRAGRSRYDTLFAREDTGPRVAGSGRDGPSSDAGRGPSERADRGPSPDDRPRVAGPASRVMRLRPGDSPVRVGARPLRRGDGSVLAVIASTRQEQLLREQARLALALAVGVTLLIAVVPGSLLVRRSLAPIGDMTRQAARIGAERLGERLPTGNPRDELGALARVLNDLLDRLQAAFAQQRRFMAEAAHELRTPVAVVRAETELALSGERPAAEYREALGVVWSESERLGRIVDDLLTLSRAEAGEYPLRAGHADLAEVVADVVRAHRALAATRDVTLVADTADELPLNGDEVLLSRMLRNLVENAVKHGRIGDQVRVEARRDGDVYVLRVADTGPGISDAARERVWEPFFRGAGARAAGAEGGAGLGLPIARWIAEAHGGVLDLAETGPHGTVFEARIPVQTPLPVA
ncbi:HAMP domain-containing sensor histidine kinase [Longimicrobium terrae]|uniref:histidine kinase n=1 Tax=Longimicrobium terrae TaxID=1639882 RepID=A0A841H179_9BACT|nr:HAMP domain-containing sensor histidine kinase [Longimicrobium terrae]MBB4637362.1 signal transduction histidine kinase [Longimicrobium terrae]MBB6071760.1 signal transduction histidine kinase [Longimicrobium terrae]NNC28520.1 HAMP domain-containing protein [Longimicrobium terrae]